VFEDGLQKLLSRCVARHMATCSAATKHCTFDRMTRPDRLHLIFWRLRQSAREIAVAMALTIVAAAFLVTTLMGDKANDGPPLAAVQRLP
jgi:hypothetical protein